ncbi:Uma2 family endonuclease [Limnoraphis robusta Tam1]|uniref:Uma2 family endonuclease n=1 Tax=Limnoraphis robusta CCNP1315 TaxID=3110306 RepID=A0ABU5U6Y9_9CYAN|nr:Uma2 family endonuclease [Limnoraphis robusta]MEA5498846.1 Uma2 family endonuclease [Limnoraphis robusta BA-68 BA1]MEA5522627.1 Uma2 family endonuclease [Limnoraphis robusta CCNP1315]MEA5541906.1 Uma2 family endonuclease [Limnoraphis robusta Tam1]MEA5546538.1 Uma2 family endonuclease [Limnoraphis robusta CCNP1324]
MVTQTQKQTYTPEEYLELEEKAEFRNEYRNGEIIPMAGGSTNHNEIAGNVLAFLKFALRGKDYRVFIGDVKLWIPQNITYTYPDIMVIQGEPIYQDNRRDIVTNPLLIVEVLSKSTKDYDQGDKFDFYRSIPCFKEYILIDQYRFYIKQFAKNYDNKWVLTDYEGEDAVLTLESVELQMSLGEIYERVNFEQPEQ